MYDFDINIVIKTLPYIIKGLKITLLVSIISSFLALIIGIFVAFLRNHNNKIVRSVSTVYVEIIRNTPLLVQLYIFYKGLPSIGISLSPILCGILALSSYAGTYISEVLRSGINSIAHEQY